MIWKGVLVRSDALRKLFYEKLPEKILDEQEDLVTYLKQQREALRKAASQIGAYRAAAQFFYNEFHRGYWDRDALQIGAAEFLDPPTLQIQEDKLREVVVAAPSTNLIMTGWSIGLSSCLQSTVRAGISVEVMTSASSWLCT